MDRKTICWQKCKVFWPGLYMHEFPAAVESHHLNWRQQVSKIVVIVIVSVYCTKISRKKKPKVNSFVRVVLTSENTVRASEEVLEVEVVGIKLMLLLSNEMVSDGEDVVVEL